MLNEYYDVIIVVYVVGYESLFYFSWEYMWMFGELFKRDIIELRKLVGKF